MGSKLFDHARLVLLNERVLLTPRLDNPSSNEPDLTHLSCSGLHCLNQHFRVVGRALFSIFQHRLGCSVQLVDLAFESEQIQHRAVEG
jgi:hypothetical protein